MEYDFAVHDKQVKQWLQEIEEENDLKSFFQLEYLAAHRESIASFLSRFHTKGLEMMLDKESLRFSYLLPPKLLISVLYKSYKTTFEPALEKYRNRVFKYTLRREQEGLRIQWQVVNAENGIIVAVGEVSATHDMSSITQRVTEFKLMTAELVEAMDVFIRESCLGEHYPLAHIDSVKHTVLDWLVECFRDKDTLICLDLTQPLFLRQLFTFTELKTYKLGDMLNMLIKHEWFFSSKRRFFEKRKVHLHCAEFEVMSPFLLEQLSVHNDIYTNVDDYRELIARYTTSPSTLIDVCHISEYDTHLSMSVLDKPEYAKIRALLDAKRHLKEVFAEIDNDAKMKLCVDNTNKKAGLLLKNRVDAYFLTNILPVLTIEKEEEIKAFIVHRIKTIADPDSGNQGAWETLMTCLDLLIHKAGATNHAQERDEAFMLIKEVMYSERPLDRPTMRAWMMDDPVNLRTLAQCVEKRVRIDVFTIKKGNQVISRSIVPCLSMPTINNIVIIEKAVVPQKNKRKVHVNPNHEKIKRIRLVKESKTCGDYDEHGLPFYKLSMMPEEEGLVSTDVHKCIVCETTQLVTHYFDTSLKSYKEAGHIPALKNICNACIRSSHRYRKSEGLK